MGAPLDGVRTKGCRIPRKSDEHWMPEELIPESKFTDELQVAIEIIYYDNERFLIIGM